jgi:hypothetical protein
MSEIVAARFQRRDQARHAIALLRGLDARESERAGGTIPGGNRVDFDPLRPVTPV